MQSENLYCDRLGIEPPRLLDLLARYQMNLRHAMIVALLEHGGPMTVEELVEMIEPGWYEFDKASGNLASALPRSWGGRQPVYRDKKGRYGLNLQARELERFLRRARLRPDPDRDNAHVPWQQREKDRAAAARSLEVEAALLARGILHCLPSPEDPAVFGILLPGEHEIRTGDAEEVRDLVRRLDVVAGLEVRETLEALGLEPDRFVLRDLRPPQKTRRFHGNGPRIKLTPSILIQGSTGIEEPLGAPALARADVAAGRLEAVRHQVEADLNSLFALYRYGVLHGFVLIWLKSQPDLLKVDWAEPGDKPYRQLVRGAAMGKRPLEAVFGEAPDWDDPWRGARRVRPERVGPGGADIYDWETEQYIYPIYVQAVRLI